MGQRYEKMEFIFALTESDDYSEQILLENNVLFFNVARQDFSHSETRNRLANLSNTDYIFFTVQDAIAKDQYLLNKLYEIAVKYNADAISCTQVPRDDADLHAKISTWAHNKYLGLNGSTKVIRGPIPKPARQDASLDNVCCLIKRTTFEKLGGFRGVFAEDLDFGIRVLESGGTIVLTDEVHIVHSHNRPELYHLKRSFVDTKNIIYHMQFAEDDMQDKTDKLGLEKEISYILNNKIPDFLFLANFDTKSLSLVDKLRYFKRGLSLEFYIFKIYCEYLLFSKDFKTIFEYFDYRKKLICNKLGFLLGQYVTHGYNDGFVDEKFLSEGI